MNDFKLIRSIDDDNNPVFISFSGGETSGDMLIRLWNKYNGKREVIVLFANTGQEWEETLIFVHNVETYYNIPVIWLEAIVDPEYGKGIKHKIVNFHTAKRPNDKNTPMEEIIKKLGIPNKDQLHCTRDLKTRVMEHYLKINKIKNHHTVVGIRFDEMVRLTSNKLFYEPAISGITKAKVNKFWSEQPFRLNLKGYQGNCRWCHKKTLRKHLTIMNETPEVYSFPERMEALYENYVHPEKLKILEKKGKSVHFPIRFFRENKSVSDIREMAVVFTDFYHDENQVYDEILDTPNGDCIDSCEPFK